LSPSLIRTPRKKRLIEQAYRGAEAAGIAVWCQDEAGPYQTVPYLGAGGFGQGNSARQAHEYVRNGTVTLLPLVRPHTGEVRAKGVRNAPNTVLQSGLHAELTAILATLPEVTRSDARRPVLARWETGRDRVPRNPVPPLRLILVRDNLAGHLSSALVPGLFQHGIMPLSTPLVGSGLNLAESLPWISGRRALAGPHPETPDEMSGGRRGRRTVAPTPRVWEGKRHDRR
jgi:hypothetical protein